MIARRLLGVRKISAITIASSANPARTVTTGNTTLDVPYPSVIAGDVIVLVYRIRSGNAGHTINTPSGFTAMHSLITSNEGGIAFWKTATGSESGNLTLTINNAAGAVIAHMFAVRGGAYSSNSRVNGSGTSLNNPANFSVGGGRMALVVNWTSKNNPGEFPFANSGSTGGTFAIHSTAFVTNHYQSLQYKSKLPTVSSTWTGGAISYASAGTEIISYMFTFSNINA